MADFIYNNENENLYLYHYTKFEIAKIILDSMKLKFNNYGNSNDPYETKELVFSIFQKEKRLDFDLFMKPIEYNKKIEILNNYKVLCFCRDKKPLLKGKLINKSCTLLRMWAQYAENHKGICLIFDKFSLFKAMSKSYNKKFYCFDVEYVDLFEINAYEHRIGISTIILDSKENNIVEVVKNNINKYPQEMFFTKDKDWENEREFRYILIGEEKKDYYINILSSIRGVILGKNVSSEHIKIIHNICCENNIYIARLNFTDYFFLEDVY